MKMMLIGLGKKAGAEVYHRAIQDYSFAQIIRSVADESSPIAESWPVWRLSKTPTTKRPSNRPARGFRAREAELLALARQLMARLLFDRADLLLVDRIGKDISGTGLNTNVVGRSSTTTRPSTASCRRSLIALRGLTPRATATPWDGPGRVLPILPLREADLAATRLNAITAGRHGDAPLTTRRPGDSRNGSPRSA